MQATAPYYQRKIKCPAHYMIPPGVDIYIREPVPGLKNVSGHVVKKYNVSKTRRKKDFMGRPVMDWRKIYELAKVGIVLQPTVTSSYAIEKIFDPLSPICQKCKGRCMEGKGTINTGTIKRLSS